jgi:hypothetical protein
MSNDLEVVLMPQVATGTNVQFILLGDGKEKPVLQARRRPRFGRVTHRPYPNEMPAAPAGADACLAIQTLNEYKTTYPNSL